jgi:hypothetical protein
MRWARTDYTNVHTVGSGLDQINAPHKSEIKMQMRWQVLSQAQSQSGKLRLKLSIASPVAMFLRNLAT